MASNLDIQSKIVIDELEVFLENIQYFKANYLSSDQVNYIKFLGAKIIWEIEH